MHIIHHNNRTRDNQAPIGLFDSGIGGLSVYQHLQELLPNESYVYFADTLNVPYGGREHQQIIQLTLNAVEWLYNKGCKLIIIACNSASAHGLEVARAKFPHIPIVGLVPALKPAVLASKSKHVAILATQATLEGQLLNTVIDDIAKPNETRVSKYFEPALVPWVEAGMPKHCPTADKLTQLLDDFYRQKVDQLVLGCTHYPFFRPFVEDYIAQSQWQLQVVDSGFAIALRVKDLLSQYDILSDNPALTTELPLYASRVDNQLEAVINRLLPALPKLSLQFINS